MPGTFRTPQEQAESVLLGDRTSQVGGGMGGNSSMDTGEVIDEGIVDVNVNEMPQGDTSQGAMDARFVDQAAQDPASAISLVAETAKTPALKNWLTDSAKNPPEQETIEDFKAFTQQYFAKSDAEKEDYFNRNTRAFENDKAFKEALPARTPNFFEIRNADRILGKGFRGVVLEPSVEAEKTTVGQRGQSVTYGTNKASIDKLAQGLDVSIQELNQGDVGKFIANSGGVYNLEKGEVVNEDTGESRVVLVNKRNPDLTVDLKTPAQIAAFDVLNALPGDIDRLNNRGAKAAFVSVGKPSSEGPTRESAKSKTKKERFPERGQAQPQPTQAPAAGIPAVDMQSLTPAERERLMTQRIRGAIGTGVGAAMRGGEAILRGASAIR
jgi:hypothetical protein